MNFLIALVPETILIGMACVLFVLAAIPGVGVRRATPWLSLASLLAALWIVADRAASGFKIEGVDGTLLLTEFTNYARMAMLAIGMLLILLHWPTNRDADGHASLHLDREAPEYFGLMLLSFAGVMLVACANDLILLLLAIELAAIPTYIMISISRPIAVAQEAAMKYFFLGAFSVAITLFGMSFLVGSTGSLTLTGIAGQIITGQSVSGWLTLGAITLLLGLSFKLAAFPLHFYAPDVYTGAATPLTALLSFVPKAAGLIAIIRVLFALTGNQTVSLDPSLIKTLWIIAVLTMTVGNVLGLMQQNLKRMMACSSIAHSGYMLTGILVLVGAGSPQVREAGLWGVLFYLVAYGLVNAGFFAVLIMLPARSDPFSYDGKIPPATSAETFGEIAGAGRNNVALGLAMAVSCFGLIGIPMTVGFFGKFYLIRPALQGGFYWLVVITMLNAAVSAGYYLRVVTTMFLKEPQGPVAGCESALTCDAHSCRKTIPLVLAASISATASLLLGCYFPGTEALRVLSIRGADVMPINAVVHENYTAQAPTITP